jgi:hypothetical protein
MNEAAEETMAEAEIGSGVAHREGEEPLCNLVLYCTVQYAKPMCLRAV